MSVVEGPVKSGRWSLVAAMAISLLPWFYFVIGVLPAKGLSLEGAIYVAAFLGALSFCITGPLAAVVARSFGAYWAVCAPTLAYQSIVFSSSIMPGFLPHVLWTSRTVWVECILAAMLTVFWYFAVYTFVRRYGSPKLWPMIVRAIGLAVFAFALIAFVVAKAV